MTPEERPPQSIIERLSTAQREFDQTSVTFHLENGVEELGVAEILDDGRQLASILVGAGVRPGDRVAVLGRNRPLWIKWAVATWLAGGVLVPMPVPVMADPAAFRSQIERLARAAGTRLTVTEPSLHGLVPDEQRLMWTDRNASTHSLPESPPAHAPAVIQFTSGSTSAPKGVSLRHAAITTAIDRTFKDAGAEPGDRMVSWLPFFHDWGLFGYLICPLVRGCDAHLLPTERFISDPAEWLRLADRVRAVRLPGPPSGWALALQATDRSGSIDLSTVRHAILGAEMIPPDLVETIRATGRAFGLEPEALRPAYGLAEAVLGVTATSPPASAHFDEVDPEALALHGRAAPSANGKRIVSCGRSIAGTDVRIGERDSSPVSDRSIGHIWIRSSTLMERYVGPGATDPFEDGWLRTGDLGYLVDGELFVTGREKDLIIVMGRNIAPEDLEWTANDVPGVKKGRSVAFAGPEREGEAIVVVEPARGADHDRIRTEVQRQIAGSAGVVPTVLVAPRGTIKKTTSGKLRRSAMREAYMAGELAP